MVRAVLGCAILLMLTPCVRALAHGEAPIAYGVVSHDAQRARAVRLSAGVAIRRAPERFQFVCPAAWGDLYPAPVAALEDGTIVVGAARGLMLLSEDGEVRAHPDPAAVGETREVVRSPQGVFSLRATVEGSEVLAVDAERVRVLWKDAGLLFSLAALDDKLVLVRARGASVEQITIAAADGAELDRQVAFVGQFVEDAFARATADAAYAVVTFGSSVVLGTLRTNTLIEIAKAELSIAGPLRAAEGTLLALDGKLSQLVEDAATPLPENAFVHCLEHNAGLSYACHDAGIARLNGPALGEPLFELRWLAAPNFALLPPGASHEDCNAQWQDLRVDLLMFGTSLLSERMDAGVPPPMLDASLRDAGIGDARAQSRVHDSSAEGGLVRDPSSAESTGDAGCGALPWSQARPTGYAAALCLALLLAWRRGGPLPHR